MKPAPGGSSRSVKPLLGVPRRDLAVRPQGAPVSEEASMSTRGDQPPACIFHVHEAIPFDAQRSDAGPSQELAAHSLHGHLQIPAISIPKRINGSASLAPVFGMGRRPAATL